MSISPEYFRYLDHFRGTVTLREFVASDAPDMIALRHDLDYSLDLALELAFWEHERGIRSSYYLLHTADYWRDPRLIEKCLQLQAFGHEVGLHLNLITDWFNTGRDPGTELDALLASLRQGGVDVLGASAHGDRACYERGFSNHWLFEDLRPNDPRRESPYNAEGIPRSTFDRPIAYPESHSLSRAPGDVLPLWNLKLRDFGLHYVASHCRYDRYFTDSGGAWIRSSDPLREDLTKGRHQVLMHPIYWRGRQRKVFVLSTARSGSLWLSKVLEAGSSAHVVHEHSLNHFVREGEVVEEKMTGLRLKELLSKPELIEEALDATEQTLNTTDRDYIEVNVYLPLTLDALKSHFPDATIVHLFRDPRAVVRSLMNRGWYDTPDDPAHPEFPLPNWPKMTPFEKCCHYIARINSSLLSSCRMQMRFEHMVNDFSYLSKVMNKCGIATYPLLAQAAFENRVNANTLTGFPEPSHWSDKQLLVFERTLQNVSDKLGYGKGCTALQSPWRRLRLLLGNAYRSYFRITGKGRPLLHLHARGNEMFEHLSMRGFEARLQGDAAVQLVPSSEWHGHRHILLDGGKWAHLPQERGWVFAEGMYYQVSLHCTVSADARPSLFCLMYNDNGDLVYRRLLALLKSGHNEASFAPMAQGERFNLAIYIKQQEALEPITLHRMELSEHRYAQPL